MTSTTTTNATNYQMINLPSQTYGGILNSWTTNTSNWTQSNLIFNENGAKIVDQIIKMQTFIVEYKALINGIIYKELIEKLSGLLDELNCMWGIGNFVGYSSPTWTTTSTPILALTPTYTWAVTNLTTTGTTY